jgi:glycosyltransferase involved in cell wall biosynthesis
MGAAAAQSGYRGGKRVAGLIRGTEAFIARKADAVATISEGFRGYLELAGVPANRIQRVRNWTRLAAATETRDTTRARLGWAPTDFVCLHAGNMGQKQGLDNLLRAANLVKDDRVKVVLVGDGNDRSRLVESARRLELRNVSFFEVQEASSFDAMLRAADVLLVNQRRNVTEMALPSKLTSFFAAGRPIIAAVDANSNAAHEITTAGAGMLVPPDDPRALITAVNELRAEPDRAGQLGACGREYSRRYLTAETALKEYDRFLRTLTEPQGGTTARG